MKQIVYIDIDDTLADYSGAIKAAKLANPAMPFPQAEYGFYSNLQPIDGAVMAVNNLLNSEVFTPYILTAPSLKNPMSYTEKRVWIERYFGMDLVERLIICPDKSLLKGAYLIDDKIKGHGQDQFEGTVLQFGSNDFPTWITVLEALNR